MLSLRWAYVSSNAIGIRRWPRFSIKYSTWVNQDSNIVFAETVGYLKSGSQLKSLSMCKSIYFLRYIFTPLFFLLYWFLFYRYLDRYRDPKSVSKEMLLKKLKDHHPFVKPDPPLKYPHAHTPYDSKDKPSWLQVDIKKERLGWGTKVNDNLDILYPEKM